MEIFVYLVVIAAVYFGTAKLTQHRFKASWVKEGLLDAMRGSERWDAEVRWIQRYYDIGYDAVIKEKEDANV